MGPIVASPIEWSYLAGIIDGEGCIRATEDQPNRKNVSPRFRIHLQITNTSAHLIDWIHNRFGGYVNLSHRPGQYKATKNCWVVLWTGGAAEVILRGVLPYLIVKKYQAELAFKLRDMVRSFSPKKGWTGRNAKLSEEVISGRRAVVEALKDAKKTQ